MKKSLASLILAVISLAASLASFLGNDGDSLIFFLISGAIGLIALYLGKVSQHTIKKTHSDDRTALKAAVTGAALGATAPWLSLYLATLVDITRVINDRCNDLGIYDWIYLIFASTGGIAIILLMLYGFYLKLYKENPDEE